ncbi:MAG: hypothetical protein R3E87_25460, partial [Burkholderiaceae bacterium]
MLWLALCFPRLPLDVLERADPAWAAQPLAIADRLALRFVNGAARAAGLHPGMKRATALALAPTTLFQDDDAGAHRQALEALACVAQRFTPSVAVWPPAARGRSASRAPDEPHELGLLLEIGASLRLFGGLEALLERLSAELSGQGVRCRAGIAAHPLPAWLFALQAATGCPNPDALLALAPLGHADDEAARQ